MMLREQAFVAVLNTIDDYTKTVGYPPTYRELSARLDIAPSAVHRWVQMLRREGLLVETEPGVARALLLSASGYHVLGRQQ